MRSTSINILTCLERPPPARDLTSSAIGSRNTHNTRAAKEKPVKIEQCLMHEVFAAKFLDDTRDILQARWKQARASSAALYYSLLPSIYIGQQAAARWPAVTVRWPAFTVRWRSSRYIISPDRSSMISIYRTAYKKSDASVLLRGCECVLS